MDAITALSYATYEPGPTLAPSLTFDIKYRPGDTAYGGRLTFEPYQQTGSIPGGWQTWSPLNGVWWASKTTAAGINGRCGQSTPCSWASIKDVFPGATIIGRLGFRVGVWTPGDWNVDAFTIGVNNAGKTFNFEGAPPTPACTGAALSASPANSQLMNQSVTLSASVANGVACSVEYRFWIYFPSNAPAPFSAGWNMMRDYSAVSTYSWTSTSVPGSYYLDTTVRATGSGVERQTQADIAYSISSPSTPACIGATLSASPATSQLVGQPVALTGGVANAGACTPEYRFWVYFPGNAPAPYQPGWNIVRDYAAGSSYSWIATSVAGDYTLAVTARSVGSGVYQQTDAYLDYTIGTVSGTARIPAPRLPAAPPTKPAPALPSAPPTGPR